MKVNSPSDVMLTGSQSVCPNWAVPLRVAVAWLAFPRRVILGHNTANLSLISLDPSYCDALQRWGYTWIQVIIVLTKDGGYVWLLNVLHFLITVMENCHFKATGMLQRLLFVLL